MDRKHKRSTLLVLILKKKKKRATKVWPNDET